jgi:hypothetical protein
MKRFTIMLAGLVATATVGTTLGFEGVAAAAHVKSASTWTTRTPGNGCEAETFVKVKRVRTLTSDFGSSGTWTGGGKTVTWTYTAGPAAGISFTGTYSKTLGGYSGTISLNGQVGSAATMMPGHLPGC